MAESPRAVDLRLTVPADAAYRDLAGELATKFAEYAGAEKHAAAELGAAVGRIAGEMAHGPSPIHFEMLSAPAQVTVRASAGAKRVETTCPLPD